MNYSNVVQTSEEYKKLCDEISNNKLFHAYLVKTEDSNYAESFCACVAAKLLNTDVSKIYAKTHPDVTIIGENGKISVENINDVVANLYVRPYSADKKVYIFYNADNMNEQSQNKLLKSLEEPPKDVIFLFSCKSTKTILQTILSRMSVIELSNIPDDKIINLLTESGTTGDVAQIVTSVCAGNSTLASKLTNQKFIDEYNLIFDLLINLRGSRDCLTYASKIDPKQVDLTEFIDTYMIIVRDVMVYISGAQKLVKNKHHMRSIENIANQFTLTACNNILAECLQLKEDLYYNTNKVAVIDRLILKTAEEKAKCKK